MDAILGPLILLLLPLVNAQVCPLWGCDKVDESLLQWPGSLPFLGDKDGPVAFLVLLGWSIQFSMKDLLGTRLSVSFSSASELPPSQSPSVLTPLRLEGQVGWGDSLSYCFFYTTAFQCILEGSYI